MMTHQTFFRPLVLVAALFSAGSFASQPASTLHQPVGKGLYELVYNQTGNSLYVSGAQGRDEQGGVVYRLDPQDLKTTQTLKSPYKPFGMALDARTGILYLGNSRESSLTSIDTRSGEQLKHLVLDSRQRSETVRPLQIREIAIDPENDRLYIPGVGADSVVWVVDAKNLTLLNTIEHTGKLGAGVALDSAHHTLYISNGDGELVVINTTTQRIEKKVKLVEKGDSALLNIASDPVGHRLFISDYKQPGVLVVDTRTDKVINKINVPESLSVLYNPQRHQLYVTHRQAGTVSIINTQNYQLEQTVKAPGLPNSLALSADGKSVFVTVKQPASREKPATAPDEVMRITL
ncbi:YncE family protein [Tatumella sp. JGM118]|uniref:7-bladed beta-propeller protein YncE n=1 Tax=Tatumella sp. JGM118 TaxID=2799796 RepID=UPI001BB0052F|nr:YncE family protein [Tatumella sp. JGM118]MBS0909928.1 YncE family protein [Tatumella sp. JGM118]